MHSSCLAQLLCSLHITGCDLPRSWVGMLCSACQLVMRYSADSQQLHLMGRIMPVCGHLYMHHCMYTVTFRKTRRKRSAAFLYVEGAVQWLNLVFWVVPNIYLLLKPCYFLGPVVFWCGWVRWTCWNTVTWYQPLADISLHIGCEMGLSVLASCLLCTSWQLDAHYLVQGHAVS